MLKKCIGIDIGRSHVRAVQMVRGPEGLRIEKAFGIQTRRSTDSLPAVLLSLTEEHGFDKRAEVAVSLPHQAFFFADVPTGPAGFQRLRAADTAWLKDHFPIAAEDIVAQVCSVLRFGGSKTSALIAATSGAWLGEQLQQLREGRIKPARIDTPITAARAAVGFNHPESCNGLAVILCVDEGMLSLAVTHDGNLLLVRNIPVFSAGGQEVESLAQETAEVIAQEIEITWRRLFDNAPDAGLRIFLVAPRGTAAMLASAIQEKIDSQIVPIDPYAHVARSTGVDGDLPVCIAEGLALCALQTEQAGRIDFLQAYRARTRPHLRITRELTICAALATAIAAVWVVGLFLQLSALESEYAELKREAEAVFVQALPEEKNIVNPAVQLQQRLDSLRQDADLFTCLDAGRPAPLQILATLSQSLPARGDLQLHDVLIAADSIRIMGSCDSFATLSAWQGVLEKTPGLTVLDIPTPKKDAASGKVHFTISLSSGTHKV